MATELSSIKLMGRLGDELMINRPTRGSFLSRQLLCAQGDTARRFTLSIPTSPTSDRYKPLSTV